MTSRAKTELQVLHNCADRLLVCFGGMNSVFYKDNGMPFEYLNFVSKNYGSELDTIFFIDNHQCWYHRGFKDITKGIDNSVIYLKKLINRKPYKKVTFTGVSSGGYAAILFGAKCNVTNVVAFMPQTFQSNPGMNMPNKRYVNLKPVVHNNNMTFPYTKTNYLLIGDKSYQKNSIHSFEHCNNLRKFENVKIVAYKKFEIKELRDNGDMKKYLDDALDCDTENDSDK